MIEQRAYGPDSSEQERKALRERVRFLADDVVLYDEVPIQSPFQIDLMFDQLRTLTASIDHFFYVISLVDARPPSAETRALLRERFIEFHPRIRHASVYTGKNFMLNVAIKFVFNGFGFSSYSVHKTLEQAMAQIDSLRPSR